MMDELNALDEYSHALVIVQCLETYVICACSSSLKGL